MTWIKKIFGFERNPRLIGNMLGTDIHSHFIPGIDDGAENMEASIDLIRSMAGLGYRKLITTPHIMSDFYRNNSENILEGLERLRDAVSAENIDIQIEAAAEYYCDNTFEKNIGREKLLTFSGNYVLIELSYMNPADNFDSVTFKLQLEGYTPVLAHPERYPYWYHQFDQYAAIREKGVLFQVNIGSLAGHYGSGPKRIAERLIEHNLVDIMGSDVHKMSHIDILRKISQNKTLVNLCDSGRLLNNQL